MSARAVVLVVLVAAVVCSATAVIYSKHRTRVLFADLQSLQRERDRLNVEWERLQLEQGAWSTHGRIERLAREALSLAPPKPGEVVMIRATRPRGLDLPDAGLPAPNGGPADGR